MIETITQYIPVVSLVVGILAFVVSAIVEVIKNTALFVKIPTDLVVIVLSVALTVVALFSYAAITNLVLTWFMIVGSVVVGFFVAFVAMYGWTKFVELWDRFQK